MARILVADDDDLLREFLNICLGASGHVVDEVGDGVAAVDRALAGNYDLILLDDVMPGLSGGEVISKIGHLLPSSTKIVLLSQFECGPESVRANGQRIFGCLQKPFCSDELMSLVGRLCAPAQELTKRDREARPRMAALAMAVACLATSAHAREAESALPDTTLSSVSATPADAPVSNADRTTANWAIGASQQWSWISNASQPQWRDTQVTAEYSPSKNALYTFELSTSSRFAKNDHLVSIRGDWRLTHNASAYLGASSSPEAHFRERWSVRAGGGIGVGHGVELSADGRIARYSTGTKFSLNPQIGVSIAHDRIAVTAGWINLWEARGKHYQGWSARLRASPVDRLRLFAGLARYPEVETGTTLRVASAYGGLSYKLSKRLELSASYSRDKYDSAFSRRSLTAGLRWTWGRDP